MPRRTNRGIATNNARPDFARPAFISVTVTLTTASAMAFLLRGILVSAMYQIRAGWDQLGLAETVALALVCLASLAAGCCAAFVWWQIGRLLVLRRYLRTQHLTLTDLLTRTAPILACGFSERALPFAADGQAHDDDQVPLVRVLPRAHATLILGDHGIGKTTVLRQCALELTRRRQTLSVALGHSPLPILISLPEYANALSSGVGLIEFAAHQLTTAGSPALAARLTRAIARWHVLLLCDGLDDVPAAALEQVVEDLGALASTRFPLARVAVTCDLARYTESLSGLTALRSFDRVVARGLSPRDLDPVLKRAARAAMSGSRTPADLTAALRACGVGVQSTHPATLAAALQIMAHGDRLPTGRANILLRALSLRLERAQSEDSDRKRTLDLLSQLAAVMRRSGLALIPVGTLQTAGAAIAQVLGYDAAVSENMDDDPSTAAAIATGILEWLPDRAALCFSAHWIESALAAHNLSRHAGGTDALVPDVLQPEWWEPFIIWAANEQQAGARLAYVLALAVPELAATDDGAQAWRPSSPAERRAALALALAAALEALVPGLPAGPNSSASAEDHLNGDVLRTVLDAVPAATQGAEGRAGFAETFAQIERESQMDLTGHLARLASMPSAERLVRAQAASILASLPSPVAAQTISALLGERDPVMRLALDQALPFASPEVYAGLQDAVSSGNEYVRLRASEVIARGGPATLRVAHASLASDDPRLRAASARALGVLAHSDARDQLVGLLVDPAPTVRIAATRALGRIGDSSVSAHFGEQLASPDPEIRAAVAGALGDLRDPSAVDTLLTLLNDTNVQVRLAAAHALGKLGDQRSTRVLRDHRGDTDPLVQAAVATALRRLGNV